MDANGDLMRESGRSGANHMNAWINVSERVTEAVSQRVLGFGEIRRNTATGLMISSESRSTSLSEDFILGMPNLTENRGFYWIIQIEDEKDYPTTRHMYTISRAWSKTWEGTIKCIRCVVVYSKGVSVLMPGDSVPTFIARHAPVSTPADRNSNTRIQGFEREGNVFTVGVNLNGEEYVTVGRFNY
ncbi:hypothetical protein YC2023_033466 [Brassica napus]